MDFFFASVISELSVYYFHFCFFYFQDTMGTIKKICDFLGKKLEPDELDLVLKYSSFQVMKENNMSNFSLFKKKFNITGLNLMRKGKEIA